MKFQLECLQKSTEWPALVKVQEQIRAAGFQAFLAGGAVRDAFLGVEPHDFDLVTEASVDDLKKIFRKVVLVGESFGVLRIIEGEHVIEVAQFRKESDYKDGRRPSLVEAATPEEDAQRRDFTVNALFYDFSSQKVADFVGGVADLQSKKIRCVGDARIRFQEDHLRILRAIRFEAQLEFSMEPATWQACQSLAGLTAKVSKERVQEELVKMLTGPRPWLALQKLQESQVMKVLFPEREKSFLAFQTQLSQLFAQPVVDKNLALIFFLWGLSQVESTFENLRWPKKEEKRILQVVSILRSQNEFFKKRKGQQLIDFQEELLRKTFEASQGFAMTDQEKKGLEQLKSQWSKISSGGQLPQALVRAEDLPKNIVGPKMGEALREAFYLQLENPEWEKEMILKEALTTLNG